MTDTADLPTVEEARRMARLRAAIAEEHERRSSPLWELTHPPDEPEPTKEVPHD